VRLKRVTIDVDDARPRLGFAADAAKARACYVLAHGPGQGWRIRSGRRRGQLKSAACHPALHSPIWKRAAMRPDRPSWRRPPCAPRSQAAACCPESVDPPAVNLRRPDDFAAQPAPLPVFAASPSSLPAAARAGHRATRRPSLRRARSDALPAGGHATPRRPCRAQPLCAALAPLATLKLFQDADHSFTFRHVTADRFRDPQDMRTLRLLDRRPYVVPPRFYGGGSATAVRGA